MTQQQRGLFSRAFVPVNRASGVGAAVGGRYPLGLFAFAILRGRSPLAVGVRVWIALVVVLILSAIYGILNVAARESIADFGVLGWPALVAENSAPTMDVCYIGYRLPCDKALLTYLIHRG